MCRTDLPIRPPTCLLRVQPAPGRPILLRPPIATHPGIWTGSVPKDQPPIAPLRVGRGHGGTGISTCCASTTPLGLALAPDLPWADEPSPGTLGHSAEGFLPPRSLLIPAFALDRAPRRFPPTLRCTIDAPLPISCEMTQLRLHA